MSKQNPSCPSGTDLLSALEGELSSDRLEAVTRHLESCPSCQKAYRETAVLREWLMSRKRPDPPQNLLERYRESLDARFPVFSRRDRIRVFPFPRVAIRPLVAFATVALVFLSGLFLGRGLKQDTPSPSPHLTESDRRFLTAFFLQSEIWLLDAVGLEDRPVSPEEWRMNQDLAARLLVKSHAVTRKLATFSQGGALDVVNRLEIFLLEATGSEDPEVKHAFQILRRELLRNLLHDIKGIQILLNPPHQEGV